MSELPPLPLSDEDRQEILDEHFLIQLPHAVFSMLFLLQLRQLRNRGTVDTHEVADAILTLEGRGRSPGTRPADQYRCSPLKRLWKKHFFDARFMAKNLGNFWGLEHGGKRLERMLDEEFVAEESGYFTEELAKRISHRLVEDAFSTRAADGRLTGEWIVFAKHEDHRFYLTLASHAETDDAIHKRILEWCRPEFPFLFEG